MGCSLSFQSCACLGAARGLRALGGPREWAESVSVADLELLLKVGASKTPQDTFLSNSKLAQPHRPASLSEAGDCCPAFPAAAGLDR